MHLYFVSIFAHSDGWISLPWITMTNLLCSKSRREETSRRVVKPHLKELKKPTSLGNLVMQAEISSTCDLEQRPAGEMSLVIKHIRSLSILRRSQEVGSQQCLRILQLRRLIRPLRMHSCTSSAKLDCEHQSAARLRSIFVRHSCESVVKPRASRHDVL